MTKVLREAVAGLGARSGSSLRGRLPGYTPRVSAGLAAYERVLNRAGLSPVVGIDEAGRGACAGPLVVAAVVFGPDGRTSVPGLADSKELQPPAREEVYRYLVRSAFAWHVVVIPPGDIDRLGLHVCNVTGMRRALAGLRCKLGFVLTDGFPVRGLGVPSLAMWKGDQGPDHDRSGRTPSAVRVRPAQGLLHAGTRQGPDGARAMPVPPVLVCERDRRGPRPRRRGAGPGPGRGRDRRY